MSFDFRKNLLAFEVHWIWYFPQLRLGLQRKLHRQLDTFGVLSEDTLVLSTKYT